MMRTSITILLCAGLLMLFGFFSKSETPIDAPTEETVEEVQDLGAQQPVNNPPELLMSI